MAGLLFALLLVIFGSRPTTATGMVLAAVLGVTFAVAMYVSMRRRGRGSR